MTEQKNSTSKEKMMIKIQNNNLKEIACEHYEAINYYIENKKRGYSLSKINEWIQNCFGKDWNFKKLLLAKPNELDYLAKNYKFKCCNDFKYFGTLYGYLNNYQDKKFTLKDNTPYRAYELIEKLNISTCLYCNRNTIYNLKNSQKRTSELDHFYPRSKYPFFAISFYNLIPSCKVCNKIKLDNDSKEYINPYDNRFDMNKNMKFGLKIKDVTFYYKKNGFELKMKNLATNPSEKKRIKNNIDDFELKDLYGNHKDIVLELIQKEIIYNESYMAELMQNYEGTLFKNEEDILRLITCGYVDDKDLHKRPLSKLIKDISEELELL
jgi:uncharacterized protein (TIGR02646 family)